MPANSPAATGPATEISLKVAWGRSTTMVTLVPLGGTYNIGFRAYIDAGEMTPIERIPCPDETMRAAPAPWCPMVQERGRALVPSATNSKWDNLRIDVHFMGHGYGVSATRIKRTRRDGAVFGGGFEPPSKALCNGTDTYGPPLLAVVNKMNDVVDTKPLNKRSTDLVWRPAVGPWEDVEREQVGARPARGPAGPALQLPARDQVRPSSQVLPRDKDGGPGGVPHINVGFIGHVDHGKAFAPIAKAPQEREGDVFAAANVSPYVPGMGAPRIGVFMNKCDMVDDPELLGEREAHAACEVSSYTCNGDSGVEPEPGGLPWANTAGVDLNTRVFDQTHNPKPHNLLRKPGPLPGDLNRYLAWLGESFKLLQPYVNLGACVEQAPHLPCAQVDNPGHADNLQSMTTRATPMDGARRTQPERITPPNKMPTQPRSGEGPLPGTFFNSRRGS